MDEKLFHKMYSTPTVVKHFRLYYPRLYMANFIKILRRESKIKTSKDFCFNTVPKIKNERLKKKTQFCFWEW
jgi:hypothetical protein